MPVLFFICFIWDRDWLSLSFLFLMRGCLRRDCPISSVCMFSLYTKYTRERGLHSWIFLYWHLSVGIYFALFFWLWSLLKYLLLYKVYDGEFDTVYTGGQSGVHWGTGEQISVEFFTLFVLLATLWSLWKSPSIQSIWWRVWHSIDSCVHWGKVWCILGDSLVYTGGQKNRFF